MDARHRALVRTHPAPAHLTGGTGGGRNRGGRVAAGAGTDGTDRGGRAAHRRAAGPWNSCASATAPARTTWWSSSSPAQRWGARRRAPTTSRCPGPRWREVATTTRWPASTADSICWVRRSSLTTGSGHCWRSGGRTCRAPRRGNSRPWPARARPTRTRSMSGPGRGGPGTHHSPLPGRAQLTGRDAGGAEPLRATVPCLDGQVHGHPCLLGHGLVPSVRPHVVCPTVHPVADLTSTLHDGGKTRPPDRPSLYPPARPPAGRPVESLRAAFPQQCRAEPVTE